MIVTVRYHGIIGDMLRRKAHQVEMPDGATVTDLYAAITDGDDETRMILKQTRAFIDGKQADRGAPLADGAEVTFMRPIAGGAGFDGGGVAALPQAVKGGRSTMTVVLGLLPPLAAGDTP
jgi:molybdopterin converting factor small subunit